jgi:hypothetical protein
LFTVANLNGTDGNFHCLPIKHDDFERRFGLACLRVLCFHSHLVESNRSISLDPEDTPRTIIESSHRLGGIRGVPCRLGAIAPASNSLVFDRREPEHKATRTSSPLPRPPRLASERKPHGMKKYRTLGFVISGD